ncbi:hypothetical protein [Sinorhizobium alkalisoli]|uniref:hypothetical protein n=1 Tax=Sinorhizobium alkalisoli TaxID=1752398 RepID=UPI001041EF0C|nr:hypothetical protein [Sinorhizobium alkalisoli]MCA1491921.1 hypothetical protein [Ensifer sp. NBAIM29]MCG5478694.1 hypothetical protein [Sinorhizobium alkalisoli]QFI67736.1 hypothetical protein EKH55_2862 [Sinorhizobium alkalisoli]
MKSNFSAYSIVRLLTACVWDWVLVRDNIVAEAADEGNARTVVRSANAYVFMAFFSRLRSPPERNSRRL